jgi:hypothetical protein
MMATLDQGFWPDGLYTAPSDEALSYDLKVDVDPATYTDDYLTKLAEMHALACKGGNGAVYTQITDVEGELNGVITYDRKVVKPDVRRLAAAQRSLIADASRATPAGCA